MTATTRSMHEGSKVMKKHAEGIVELRIGQATMATAGQVKKAAWGTAFTILGIAIAAVVMILKLVPGVVVG